MLFMNCDVLRSNRLLCMPFLCYFHLVLSQKELFTKFHDNGQMLDVLGVGQLVSINQVFETIHSLTMYSFELLYEI